MSIKLVESGEAVLKIIQEKIEGVVEKPVLGEQIFNELGPKEIQLNIDPVEPGIKEVDGLKTKKNNREIMDFNTDEYKAEHNPKDMRNIHRLIGIGAIGAVVAGGLGGATAVGFAIKKKHDENLKMEKEKKKYNNVM